MLTSITLHGPALDNAGRYIDAGTELVVGDDGDMIDATRARAIVSAHGASGHRAPAEAEEEPQKAADKPAKATKGD